MSRDHEAAVQSTVDQVRDLVGTLQEKSLTSCVSIARCESPSATKAPSLVDLLEHVRSGSRFLFEGITNLNIILLFTDGSSLAPKDKDRLAHVLRDLSCLSVHILAGASPPDLRSMERAAALFTGRSSVSRFDIVPIPSYSGDRMADISLRSLVFPQIMDTLNTTFKMEGSLDSTPSPAARFRSRFCSRFCSRFRSRVVSCDRQIAAPVEPPGVAVPFAVPFAVVFGGRQLGLPLEPPRVAVVAHAECRGRRVPVSRRVTTRRVFART